jgi:hypothetical protein
MNGTVLRSNWYTRRTESFDLKLSGIYEWRIEGVGVYIGKATRLRDRLGAYPRNVRYIIEGRLAWESSEEVSGRSFGAT